MDYDRYDAFLHHIFKQTQADAWFRPSEEHISTGVCLRIEPGKSSSSRTLPAREVSFADVSMVDDLRRTLSRVSV